MHQGDEEMVMNDDYINLRERNEKWLKKEDEVSSGLHLQITFIQGLGQQKASVPLGYLRIMHFNQAE